MSAGRSGRSGRARREKELKRAKKIQDAKRNAPRNPFAMRPTSVVLTLFSGEYIPNVLRNSRNEGVFFLPRLFSITHNCSEVLRVVSKIARYAREAKIPKLTINSGGVERAGLSAVALLGAVIEDIVQENSRVTGSYIRDEYGNKFSVEDLQQKISKPEYFAANDGVDDGGGHDFSSVYHYRNFGAMTPKNKSGKSAPSVVTERFCDHLDRSLSLVGLELSPQGKDHLFAPVAEVLGNAQEHSGGAEWVISGFVGREFGQIIYRAAIISFGRSISSNFEMLPEGSFAKLEALSYWNFHKPSPANPHAFTMSDLLMVKALQRNISSKKADESSDRGQGTFDLINFYQQMSDEVLPVEQRGDKFSPVMSILSGRTHIILDGKYRMTECPRSGLPVIAFNDSNDLDVLPDESAVVHMPDCIFHGTLISIAIPISGSEVLVSKDGSHDN